ncbi:MAG: hypothetical protein PHZ19_06260, partial [Candidatus Thermoplasmatota archaeon]|nr:hypothetical protein [Candidatus Thermoplasmatota archaeon]
MTLGGMDVLHLAWGLALFVVPGALWSRVLFRKMSLAGRVALGFGLSLVAVTGTVLLLSLAVAVSGPVVYGVVALYGGIPLAWLLLRREMPRPEMPDRRTLLRLALLLGVLAFVMVMTHLPHLENGYGLPFHADEWVHWGYTRSFMESGGVDFANPFTGAEESDNPEIGFHAFLGCFTWLSGASLQTVFVYLPALIAALTGLAAYVLGERSRRRYGLGAAFFVAFLPTTIRFLGPSFLVPVALGLLLALLALILAEATGATRYPLLFALVLVAMVMHPPSAVALAVVLLCHAAVRPLDGRYREGGLLALVTLAPLALSYVIVPARFFQQGMGALFGETYVSNLSTISLELQSMSVVAWGLFFLGAFLALWRGRALQRGLAVATLAFLAVVLAYGEYGLGLPILYDRVFLYLFLLVAVL